MADPEDPRALELRRLLQRLFRRFGVVGGDVTPCNKPLPLAHAHALMILLTRAECSQQQLAAELGIDKSNVARLCARMVESGHLRQRQSELDGRSRRISLTSRGRRLAQEVDDASRARFGALLQALPSRQRGLVLSALDQLVTAIETLPLAVEDPSSSPGEPS